MKNSSSNQAEVRSQGHNGDTPYDPHLNTAEGGDIGLSTNFGITHKNISGMHSEVGVGQK